MNEIKIFTQATGPSIVILNTNGDAYCESLGIFVPFFGNFESCKISPRDLGYGVYATDIPLDDGNTITGDLTILAYDENGVLLSNESISFLNGYTVSSASIRQDVQSIVGSMEYLQRLNSTLERADEENNGFYKFTELALSSAPAIKEVQFQQINRSSMRLIEIRTGDTFGAVAQIPDASNYSIVVMSIKTNRSDDDADAILKIIHQSGGYTGATVINGEEADNGQCSISVNGSTGVTNILVESGITSLLDPAKSLVFDIKVRYGDSSTYTVAEGVARIIESITKNMEPPAEPGSSPG